MLAWYSTEERNLYKFSVLSLRAEDDRVQRRLDRAMMMEKSISRTVLPFLVFAILMLAISIYRVCIAHPTDVSSMVLPLSAFAAASFAGAVHAYALRDFSRRFNTVSMVAASLRSAAISALQHKYAAASIDFNLPACKFLNLNAMSSHDRKRMMTLFRAATQAGDGGRDAVDDDSIIHMDEGEVEAHDIKAIVMSGSTFALLLSLSLLAQTEFDMTRAGGARAGGAAAALELALLPLSALLMQSCVFMSWRAQQLMLLMDAVGGAVIAGILLPAATDISPAQGAQVAAAQVTSLTLNSLTHSHWTNSLTHTGLTHSITLLTH